MRENPANVDRSKWDKDTLLMEDVSAIPAAMLHRVPEFEVQGRNGEVLKVSAYYYHFKFSERFEQEITADKSEHAIIRMFVKNTKGEIVGIRNSTLFRHGRISELSSEIKVRDKGRGYAKPVDEGFMLVIQSLADELQETLTWRITNTNRDKLNNYKESSNPDPKVLAALEEEQLRWQALYGEGGKIGVVKGRKVFSPRPKEVESVSLDIRKKSNEIF